MEAFQHYSYIKSNKVVICCDLQGVKHGSTFILTDPAVLSEGSNFGNTDMGLEYQNKLLSLHKCNEICAQLGMTNHLYNKKLKPITDSTTLRKSHKFGL
jgi:hypothetical protein